MDLTYATIVSDEANPTNDPIFALDTYLGSSLLQITDAPEAPFQIRKQPLFDYGTPPPNTYIWKMFFNGASSNKDVDRLCSTGVNSCTMKSLSMFQTCICSTWAF